MLKETTGQTIKYLREKNDLTREDLCQMIRLGGNSRAEDVQRLYKVENDKMELDDSVIETLAQLFDVKVKNIKEEANWIHVSEAADVLGCTDTTIYNRYKKGKLDRKKIGNKVYYKKGQIENLEINKRKNIFDEGENKDYFTKRDLFSLIDGSNSLIRVTISDFKNDFPEKVMEIESKSNNIPFKNAINKKYINDFRTYFQKRNRDWISGNAVAEIVGCSIDTIYRYAEKGKIETRTEGKTTLYNKEDALKNKAKINENYKKFRSENDEKTKELRNLIKSQSAKIKELNKKVEKTNKKLEGIKNGNNYRDNYIMERDSILRKRINDLENLIEVLQENINQKIEVEIKNDDKGFFGRLFS